MTWSGIATTTPLSSPFQKFPPTIISCHISWLMLRQDITAESTWRKIYSHHGVQELEKKKSGPRIKLIFKRHTIHDQFPQSHLANNATSWETSLQYLSLWGTDIACPNSNIHLSIRLRNSVNARSFSTSTPCFWYLGKEPINIRVSGIMKYDWKWES